MKGTTDRINRLSRSESIAKLIASAHVNASDTEVLRDGFAKLTGFENAPTRELFIFASALLSAHHVNRARYSVALAS